MLIASFNGVEICAKIDRGREGVRYHGHSLVLTPSELISDVNCLDKEGRYRHHRKQH